MKKLISAALFFISGFLAFSQTIRISINNMQMEEIIMDDEAFIDKDFYISEISESLFQKMKGKSYKENCTIPTSDLRYIHLLHWNFRGNSTEGEMVCHKIIAEKLLEIFKELYRAHYQIEKIRLIDEYNADDEFSMSNNNSSCFNFRFISHTTIISNHGKGMAVDINPLYNPYWKKVKGKDSIEPANSAPYLDRTKNFPHKIDHNDLCFKLFTKYGFTWGGDWTNCKDYQHFEFEE